MQALPSKIKVGDTATYTNRMTGSTERGVIKNILLREQAHGKSGVDVSEVSSADVLLCIFDIGAHRTYGSYITAIEPQKVYADVPAAEVSKPFLGSFIALAFAFSLSIVGCYIQPQSVPYKATAVPTSADYCAKADKHQLHFDSLQKRLKHGHSEALYFIRNYSKDIELIGKAYDICPEIIMSVAILESLGGTSNISRQARNFHGIKAYSDWDGLTFTCSKGKTWRAWNTNNEGLEGFCQYICERMPDFVGRDISTIEFAYAYGSEHPKQYAKQLNSIIARYGLKTLFS